MKNSFFRSWNLFKTFPLAMYLEADRDDEGGLSGTHGGQTSTGMGPGDETFGMAHGGSTTPGFVGDQPPGGKGRGEHGGSIAENAFWDAVDERAKSLQMEPWEVFRSLLSRGVIGTIAGLIGKGLDANAAFDKAMKDLGFTSEQAKGFRTAAGNVPGFNEAINQGDGERASEILINNPNGGAGVPGGAGLPGSDTMTAFGNIGIPGLTEEFEDTRMVGARDAVENWFHENPEREAAFQKALAANPKWTREEWAKANAAGAGLPMEAFEGTEETFTNSRALTVSDMYKGRFDNAQGAKDELEVEKDNWNKFKKEYKDGFAKIAGQYESEIAGIPKLNVNVGEMFGGASTPMAPGKHVDVAGQKRDAREGGLTRSAGIESTAMANVSNNIANRYKIGHKQYDDPIQEALDIFSLDKTLANKTQIAELVANTQKDINSGSSLDLISAIAFGAGSL